MPPEKRGRSRLLGKLVYARQGDDFHPADAVSKITGIACTGITRDSYTVVEKTGPLSEDHLRQIFNKAKLANTQVYVQYPQSGGMRLKFTKKSETIEPPSAEERESAHFHFVSTTEKLGIKNDEDLRTILFIVKKLTPIDDLILAVSKNRIDVDVTPVIPVRSGIPLTAFHEILTDQSFRRKMKSFALLDDCVHFEFVRFSLDEGGVYESRISNISENTGEIEWT